MSLGHVDFGHDFHTFSEETEKVEKEQSNAALLVGIELAGSAGHYSGCVPIGDLPDAAYLAPSMEALVKANPALASLTPSLYVHYSR